MADIFLSYKREDRDKARPLVEALRAHGWSVWWDSRIGVGETWDRVIEAELAAAKCVVVVWSKLSVESDWVRAEAHEGRERKCLVPVTIEGVSPPSIFKMMQAANLTLWRGDLSDAAFTQVVAAVGRIVPPTPDSADSALRVSLKEHVVDLQISLMAGGIKPPVYYYELETLCTNLPIASDAHSVEAWRSATIKAMIRLASHIGSKGPSLELSSLLELVHSAYRS